ncbi:MAG TPA: MFS transporter [Terriglobales bacterium]|nr:MFS transporter [Terriglobales bacterium]
MILAAFRVRSFRFQWPADLLTSLAFEMETLILGWFVMVHTGSVVLLTAFGSLQHLGTLAAPMFGVLGDRLGVRTMLCAMRVAYASLAIILMILALTGNLGPVAVLLIASLSGIVRPNDQVMRNALIGETIPPAYMINALSASRASMDSARVAGALAGAGLSTLLGIGPAYAVITALYVASLALSFGIARSRPAPVPGEAAGGVARPSRYADLKDGLVYVWTTPTLLAVMVLAFLVNLTAYPVSGGLLPYVAKQVFVVDATGLGWLSAGFSFGALLGSIAMVVSGGPRRTDRATFVYAALWYLSLLGFAHAPSFAIGVVVLFVAGLVQSVAMISLMGVVLEVGDPRFRARVMGVRMLAVYGLPLGLLGSGVLIERAGYAATVSLLCVIGLVCTVAIGMRWRASVWHPRGADGLGVGRPLGPPPVSGR